MGDRQSAMLAHRHVLSYGCLSARCVLKNGVLGAQVFSRIWDHVKKNGLQDPADRDTILLDDQLSKLFSPPATIDSVKRELSRHVIKDQ